MSRSVVCASLATVVLAMFAGLYVSFIVLTCASPDARAAKDGAGSNLAALYSANMLLGLVAGAVAVAFGVSPKSADAAKRFFGIDDPNLVQIAMNAYGSVFVAVGFAFWVLFVMFGLDTKNPVAALAAVIVGLMAAIVRAYLSVPAEPRGAAAQPNGADLQAELGTPVGG